MMRAKTIELAMILEPTALVSSVMFPPLSVTPWAEKRGHCERGHSSICARHEGLEESSPAAALASVWARAVVVVTTMKKKVNPK